MEKWALNLIDLYMYIWVIFTHLKLSVAAAKHNLNWVKIEIL